MPKITTIRHIDGSESKVYHFRRDSNSHLSERQKIAALKRRTNITLLCGKDKDQTMAHIMQKKRKEQYKIQCDQFRSEALTTQYVKWCIEKNINPGRFREARVSKYGTVFDAFEVLLFKYKKEDDPKYKELTAELEENLNNEYGRHCDLLVFVKDPEETEAQMIRRLVKETMAYMKPKPIRYTEIVDQYDQQKDKVKQVKKERKQERLPQNLFILADLSSRERILFLKRLHKKQKKNFILCDRTCFICDGQDIHLPSPLEGWNAVGAYDIDGNPIRYKRYHDTLI